MLAPYKAIIAAIFMLCLTTTAGSQSEKPIARNDVDVNLRKLNDGDPKIRKEALDNIALVAFDLRSSLGTLVFKLENDPDPTVRFAAARAIQAIGPTAATRGPFVLEGLEKTMNDNNDDVRTATIRALGALAPFSKSVLPKIIPLINDRKSPAVQKAAIRYVGALGAEAKVALPALIKALDDPDKGMPGYSSVRQAALEEIPNLGADAKLAASALQKILESGDDLLKAMTLKTLAKIIPHDSKLIPILVSSLKNKEHPSLRYSAALALGSLGAGAKEAVPDLIAVLKTEDVVDRKLDLKIKGAALLALGEIGSFAKEAIPAIQALLAQIDDEFLRLQGELALKRIRGEKGE